MTETMFSKVLKSGKVIQNQACSGINPQNYLELLTPQHYTHNADEAKLHVETFQLPTYLDNYAG